MPKTSTPAPLSFDIRASSFYSPFIEFDQIEISPNIFASFASRLFQKMEKTRPFRGGVGMTRYHRLVPPLDCFRGMSRSVFLHPVYNCAIVIEYVGDLFKCIAV